MTFLVYLEMASYVSERLFGALPLRELVGNRIGYVALVGLLCLLVYKLFSSVDDDLRSVLPELRPKEPSNKKTVRRINTALFFGMPAVALAIALFRTF